MNVKLILVYLNLILISIAFGQNFGPEWVKNKAVNSYNEYSKEIKIKVSHSAKGNVTNYHLPIQNDSLLIAEDDSGKCTWIITRNTQDWFLVNKNLKGKPESYTIIVNEIVYHDLNGDGIFDARLNKRTDQAQIIYDDKYINVIGFGHQINKNCVIGKDDKKYFFDGFLWKIKNLN